jgi:hypothetical protein
MKMVKQFFLVPALAFWIVCVGLVMMSSCGSNRGSATEKHYPGNALDEPEAPEDSEEGVHEGEKAEGHAAEQPGEVIDEKREHAGEATEAKPDTTAKVK